MAVGFFLLKNHARRIRAMRTRNVLIVAATVLIMTCLYLAFPIYQTQRVGGTSGNSGTVLQSNRFTGKSYLLRSGGWEKIEYPEDEISFSPDDSPGDPLPDSKVDRLEGWGGFEGETDGNLTRFSGSIYNGTVWRVNGITVGLVALDAERDTVWGRVFTDDVQIRAYDVGSFDFQVLTGEQFEEVNWSILEAWGVKRENFSVE